jgi:hypothetical protein
MNEHAISRRGVISAAAIFGVVGGAVGVGGTRPGARLFGASSAAAATAPTIIGMSAPASSWALRTREVGPGLAARRIFADLANGATSQIKLVEEAHRAGQLPVISYKVGGDVTGAINGKYNAVAKEAAARLASYGLPTAVTIWHEPYGDLTGAQYAAMTKQILPSFKRGSLRVGPILNGWLLDNKVSTFATYCPNELFGLWDWFGIDTYESGTISSPGKIKPADRIPKLSKYLSSRGFSRPLGVGEYNGYSAATIAAVGEALMGTPNVWFGCMWNSTTDGGKGEVLTGSRLEAFRGTLRDMRSCEPLRVA